jgi:hypothetical protein
MAKGEDTANHPSRRVDREAMARQAALKAQLPQLHPQQVADLRQRTEIREEHYKVAHPDIDRYDDED